MSPFVRARLRDERGLAPDALVEQRGEQWFFGTPSRLTPIGPDAVESGLGCAAAVVVSDAAALRRALAWAAPTVTSRAAAEAVGAEPGIDVLVAATAAERVASAGRLVRDELLASRLSWRGYRAIEGADAERAAVVLVERLGLLPATPPRPAPPLPTVELALRLLGAPADAHVRTRLAEASMALVGGG
jgi:hypothetical protein